MFARSLERIFNPMRYIGIISFIFYFLLDSFHGEKYRSPFTLRNIYFPFLSNSMEYDRGDRFSVDMETNLIPFGSKSKRKLSLQINSFQVERKCTL